MSEAWSAWRASEAWSLGVEEEVMLLDARTGRLAQVADDVLPRLASRMGERVCSETHQGVVELVTAPHDTVPEVIAELAATRAELEAALAPYGLSAAAAGTHPTTTWEETGVSPATRHQLVLDDGRPRAARADLRAARARRRPRSR